MRIALDSNTLVAGLLRAHPHHRLARRWVLPDEDSTLEREICGHALAEVYSVLTRLPAPLRVHPSVAEAALARLAVALTVRPVTESLQRAALQRCVRRGLPGGAVHDALHLVSAESAGVEGIVTFDARQFERLREPTSPRVIDPADSPR